MANRNPNPQSRFVKKLSPNNQIGSNLNVPVPSSTKPVQSRQLKRRAPTPDTACPPRASKVPPKAQTFKPVAPPNETVTRFDSVKQKQKKLKMAPPDISDVVMKRSAPSRAKVTSKEVTGAAHKQRRQDTSGVLSLFPSAGTKGQLGQLGQFPGFPSFPNSPISVDIPMQLKSPSRQRTTLPSPSRGRPTGRESPVTPRLAFGTCIENSRFRSPTPRNSGTRLSCDSPPPIAPRRRNQASFLSAILSNNKEMVLEANSIEDQDPNAPIFVHFNQYNKDTGFPTDHRSWQLPLLAAARLSTPGVVKNLISCGAVVTSVSETKQTALHMLATQPGPEFKRNFPFQTNIVPSEGVSLMLDGDGESLRLPIFSQPASVRTNVISEEECTVREKELSLTAYILIQNGVNIDQKDDFGKTALDYSVEFGHPLVTKVVLEEQDAQRRKRYNELSNIYPSPTIRNSPLPNNTRTPVSLNRRHLPNDAMKALTPQIIRFTEEFIYPQQISNHSRGFHTGECAASYIGFNTPVKSSSRRGGHERRRLVAADGGKFPNAGVVR